MNAVDKIKAERAAKREAQRLSVEQTAQGLRATLEAADVNNKIRAAKEAKKPLKKVRYKARVILPPQDGPVFVLSDMHVFPGEKTPLAIRAALHLAEELRPWAVINNGDTLDGASISRWPVGSFQELAGQPTVAAEIGAAARQLAAFEALPGVDYLVWNLGNHDARFESRLAQKVPEFAELHGFALKDHFPGWMPAWTTQIGKEVEVRHRHRGGEFAAYNNARDASMHMVTGHDHRLWAKPHTNRKGVFWGIDAGTTADPDSKAFLHYTEDAPCNWQQGFVILHFEGGKFIQPELVHCYPDGRVPFRGKLLKIK